ncbi:hypothetical protein SNEBB_008970 [Seison nebaliae]|nr:hypothetical protein SNEBB_008970 [Seison nebaliae]
MYYLDKNKLSKVVDKRLKGKRLREADDKRNLFFYRYGSYVIGGTTLLTSLVIRHVHARLFMGKDSLIRIAHFGSVVLLPSLVSYELHEKLVKKKLLEESLFLVSVDKWKIDKSLIPNLCSTCYSIRSNVCQLMSSILQPYIISTFLVISFPLNNEMRLDNQSLIQIVRQRLGMAFLLNSQNCREYLFRKLRLKDYDNMWSVRKMKSLLTKNELDLLKMLMKGRNNKLTSVSTIVYCGIIISLLVSSIVVNEEFNSILSLLPKQQIKENEI